MFKQGDTSQSGLEYKLHPLVLINVSDHHTRLLACQAESSATVPRALGLLLGSQDGRKVDISNSFEVCYDVIEGECVLDTEFAQRRLEQYKEVQADVDMVGWYATGEEVGEVELDLHKKMMEMCEGPVYLHVVPAQPDLDHRPQISLFESEYHIIEDQAKFIFVKVPYALETSEAERVGVTQVAEILPLERSSATDKLSLHLQGMVQALKQLETRLATIHQYLEKVESGQVDGSQQLLRDIKQMLLRLPVMEHDSFQQALTREYTDALLLLLLSSMTKASCQASASLLSFSKLVDSTRKPSGVGSFL